MPSATIQVDPHSGKADGVVTVTLTDNVPAIITLRAPPLALGDSYAFVRFNATHADTIDVDPTVMHCQPTVACQISFTVEGAWKNGLYQGVITASRDSSTLASIPLSAMRAAPAFQPVLTSDALHGGRLVVDATSQPEFLVTVQDPQGAPPAEFVLTGSADAALNCEPPAPLTFSPDHFHLEPGDGQTVVAAVQPCVPAGDHFLLLHIGSATDKAAGVDTVVAVTRHTASAWRSGELLLYVMAGSIISVMLNNIFPVSRTRRTLRTGLRQVYAVLRDSGQAGTALLDGLRAETRRIELSLKQVRFFSATKVNDIQAAQASVATLTTAAGLARRIGQTRSAADSATLPIITHAAIRQKLRDAEDALRGGDPQAAADRLQEAQSKLTEAQNDVQQTALKTLLGSQLTKMMTERGRIVPPPQTPAAGSPAQPPGRLVQDQTRDPRIRKLVQQLAVDMAGLGTLDARDMLDVEHDLYIADIWTEYVEARLQANPERFRELAESLLDLLVRNPKSEQVQTLLDLLRSETTPREIALSLAGNQGVIECDLHPRALESVDIAFNFVDPALQAVPAAKRLLIYDWYTGDDTTPPPSVHRFSHYFRPPRRGCRFWESAERSYDVTLAIRVPFTSITDAFPFGTIITPRVAVADWWRAEPMEIASFFVSVAIAVATAFGTQYGSGVPEVVTWPACLSAFMLGFGLDQLRDTISPTAATLPAANPPAAASAASHPAGHTGP